MRTILVLTLLPAFSATSFAAEWIVPDQYSTIQAAINASGNGDRIRVRAGTYNELIDFNGKAITVFGEAGAPSTFIQGGGNGPVVRLDSNEGPRSVLYGFTIRNGSVPFGEGGGIYCANSSPTLRGLVVQDNSAGSGGGLAIVGGSPHVEGCTILENTCLSSGAQQGANVYISGTDPDFVDCTIGGDPAGNSGAIEGGGAFVSGSSVYKVRFERCRFSYCDASTRGGAIACIGTELVLSRCMFTFNDTAGRGGAVYAGNLLSGAIATISNCWFYANDTTGVAGRGGALAVETGGTTYVKSCTFAGNDAGWIGGNAYCGAGALEISNSILYFGNAVSGDQLAVDIFSGGTASSTVSWSDVQGGQSAVHVGSFAQLNWGSGNIDLDPKIDFLEYARLKTGSPCIDAGDPGYVAGALEREFPGLDGILYGYPGELRMNVRLDMGSDEYWDCNGNGLPDHSETFPDCNLNKIPDACEIAQGIVPDLDGNGVPDDCQVLGTALCFTSVPNAPCGNYDASAGAQNRTGIGAELNAVGSLSVGADDLRLVATGLSPGVPSVFFTGTSAVQVFHDNGVRCAGGSVLRRKVNSASSVGAVSFGPGLGALTGWTAGQSFVLQIWYRDGNGPCGSASNFSNALQVLLVP